MDVQSTLHALNVCRKIDDTTSRYTTRALRMRLQSAQYVREHIKCMENVKNNLHPAMFLTQVTKHKI